MALRRVRMRMTLAAAAVLAVPYNVLPSGEDMPAFALRISRAGSVTHASCTLIAKHGAGEQVVLYFVTAARLFATAERDRGAPIASVVIDPHIRRLLVRPDDVIVPTGMPIDVALLRVTLEHSDLEPARLAFDPPAAAALFTIHGIADGGGRLVVPQRVRIVSTASIAGDVAVQWRSCVGAPAGVNGRMFGVVTDCDTGRGPTVSLLGSAREFLARHVRALTTTTRPSR